MISNCNKIVLLGKVYISGDALENFSLIFCRFMIEAVNMVGAGPFAEATITTPESEGTHQAYSLQLLVHWEQI